MSYIENRILASLGLEDIDVDINFNDSEEAEAQILESVAQSQVEVIESVAELEETTENAETVEEDIESLEALVSVMAKSLKTGKGLDTISNEMFNAAFTGVTAKYGFKAEDVLPSMESFGHSPYQNTVVSMEESEGVLQKLKNAFNALIEKVKKAAQYVWDKIKAMLGGVAKFARSVKDKIFKSKKDKVIVLANGLKVKSGDADKFVKAVSKYAEETAGKLAKLQKEAVAQATKDPKAAAEKLPEYEKQIDELLKEFHESIKGTEQTEEKVEVTKEDAGKVAEDLAKDTPNKTNDKVKAEEESANKQNDEAVKNTKEGDADAEEKVTILTRIKNAFSKAWASVKSFIGRIWTAITSFFKAIVNKFKSDKKEEGETTTDTKADGAEAATA